MNKSDNNREGAQLFELSGILTVVVLFLMFNFYMMYKLNAPVQIDLTLETEKESKFQVYWRQSGNIYEESKSVTIKTYPEQTNYTFKISSFGAFDWLRIDPVNNKSPVSIHRLTLHHYLYEPIVLFPNDQILVLENSYQLGSIRQHRETGLSLKPSGKDPHFELPVSPSLKKTVFYSYITLICVATILLFLLCNQRLLKGSKQSATVQVIIPAKENQKSKTNILAVARKYCVGSRMVSLKSETESDKVVVYFPVMTSSTLNDFIHDVKRVYHTAHCRIHYNRSGEV